MNDRPKLSGALEDGNPRHLRDALAAAAGSRGKHVLDFTGVETIDLDGFAALEAASAELHKQGASLMVMLSRFPLRRTVDLETIRESLKESKDAEEEDAGFEQCPRAVCTAGEPT
ncbi:MAG TPA: STAS domain-containing protein [Planctomycetota bacterium]|nr:STAS domain-containing protein [Planctomycetota bacterium]